MTRTVLSRVKAYLDICRVSNLPTVWTNVLAAQTLTGEEFAWSGFLLLASSLSLFYAGGMCLNDICDLEIDRQKRPNRPLPSGRISVGRAGLFTGILFLTALLLLAAVPHRSAFLPGAILLAAIIAYDCNHKHQALSVLFMAACRLLVYVVTSVALTGTVKTMVAAAGMTQFLYVFVICLVARHENSRAVPFRLPLVPAMIAGISLLDGVMMAMLVSAAWLPAGVAGMGLTLLGQRYVRGD